MYDLLDRLTLDFDGFFVLHNIQHCLDQSLSNNCKSSRTAFDVELFNSHRIIYPFWNQYLWFLSIQSLCQTTADLHKKNPACADASVSKGGFIIGPWLCPLISNFDPCSIYPPCVKGPWRTFSLMRTVLRGDTKSYKITTSKPLLSKLRFVIPQAVKMPRITF